MTTMNENIKKAFFFLDYLRMHSYGKKQKVFKKNRYMMNPETATCAKKGYRAYIQRMFRDLVDAEMKTKGFPIKKPRDVFGYNIGNPNARSIRIPNKYHESPHELYLYAVKRYLMYGEFEEELTAIKDIVSSAPGLRKFNGMYFEVRLNVNTGEGWNTFLKIKEIKEQLEIIEEKFNPEDLIKTSIAKMLRKTLTPKAGMRFYKYRNGAPDTSVVFSVSEVQFHGGASFEVGYQNSDSMSYIDSSQMEIFDCSIQTELNQAPAFNALLEELIEKTIDIARGSSVGIDSCFRLAKSLLVRRAPDGDRIDEITAVELTSDLETNIRGRL